MEAGIATFFHFLPFFRKRAGFGSELDHSGLTLLI
jgi:hypothetical protein